MKQLGPEQVCRRFSAEDPPGLRVESGEDFSVRTTDRFRNVSKTDPRLRKVGRCQVYERTHLR